MRRGPACYMNDYGYQSTDNRLRDFEPDERRTFCVGKLSGSMEEMTK